MGVTESPKTCQNEYTCKNESWQVEKFFWGVTRSEENLPGRNTKKKSLLMDFWLEMTLQVTWNDVKAPKKCENNAWWSKFYVKICEMCYF